MPRQMKRKARQTHNYQSFYLRVDDCEPSYSFAVNNTRCLEGPYWEHLEMTVRGPFLAPERVKGRQLKAVFLGNREEQRTLQEVPSSDWKPLSVGVLTIRGERTEFLGSLPYDAMWGLVQAFSAGRFRIISFYGALERGGSAKIQSLHFSREVDPDDLAGA